MVTDIILTKEIRDYLKREVDRRKRELMPYVRERTAPNGLCGYCSKPLTQIPGYPNKKYCSRGCQKNAWEKENRIGKRKARK